MSLGQRLNREHGFDAPLQELLYTAIYTADHFERNLAEFLKPYGLTTCQYDILVVIQDAGGRIPNNQIDTRLVKQASALGAYLDRLVKAGLVTRVRSEEDRRHVNVLLTSEGLRTLDAIHHSLTDWEDTLIGHLTPTEARSATEILHKAARL